MIAVDITLNFRRIVLKILKCWILKKYLITSIDKGAIQISADSTFGLFQTHPPYPDSTLTLCSRPSHPTLTRQGVISIDIDFFNDNLLLEH